MGSSASPRKLRLLSRPPTACLAWMIASSMGTTLVTKVGRADCIDYADYLHWVGGARTLGGAIEVTVAGTYAYVADGGSGLQVLDVSEPSAPVIVGSVDTPGAARGVAVAGTHAYIADDGRGLQIVDISNSSFPVIVGSVDTPGHASRVAVAGSNVCIADGEAGLQVVDISDPSSPAIVASVNLNYASDVAIQGAYAYVVGRYQGHFQILDISDPTSPGIVGSLNTSGSALAVAGAHAGAHAYIADGDEQLFVIDISDPVSPAIEGSIYSGVGVDVAVEGTLAYLVGPHGADYPGLAIVDVSDPTDPRAVSSIGIDASAVTVMGGRAYVTGGVFFTPGRLQILDVSNPLPPPTVGGVPGLHTAFVMAVAGSFACTGDGGRILVVDISNPASPMVRGAFDLPDVESGLDMSGRYVYVTGGAFGLMVADIADPSSPMIVGSVNTPGDAQDVAVSEDYAYVADGTAGLQVVDVSDPTSLSIVGSIGGLAHDVAVATRWRDGEKVTYAYVIGSQMLRIVDVSNPTNPVLLGSTTAPGSAIAVSGDHAYVAGIDLHAIDVSNPAHPVILGSALTPSGALDVALGGSHAYVAGYISGLQVFDITDPASPSIQGGVSFCFPYGSVRAVAVDESHVYVPQFISGQPLGSSTGTECGLVILSRQCEMPTPVELSALAATPSPAGIKVTWTTGSESDHVGFHVHRSTRPDGDYIRVSAVQIEPPAPSEFVDTNVAPGTTYFYRVEAVDLTGGEFFGPVSARFDVNRLAQSRPNPFPPENPFTEIQFNLVRRQRAIVRLFDASGRLVRLLLDESLEAGTHSVRWDGRNDGGEQAGSGVYFYELDAAEFSVTRTLVRLR